MSEDEQKVWIAAVKGVIFVDKLRQHMTKREAELYDFGIRWNRGQPIPAAIKHYMSFGATKAFRTLIRNSVTDRYDLQRRIRLVRRLRRCRMFHRSCRDCTKDCYFSHRICPVNGLGEPFCFRNDFSDDLYRV